MISKQIIGTKLTTYELEFINCFGKFFELNGQSDTLGRIFGLLYLKATSSETGLVQKKIVSLIGKSKATISRNLDILVKQGFCSYILEDNEISRAERKYYVKGSYKEIAISRLKKSLANNMTLNKNLHKIEKNIPKREIPHNEGLLTRIDLFAEFIDLLVKTQNMTIEMFDKHYSD
jgi:DNA-binding transcriptional regulator GbsR (MarR family)